MFIFAQMILIDRLWCLYHQTPLCLFIDKLMFGHIAYWQSALTPISHMTRHELILEKAQRGLMRCPQLVIKIIWVKINMSP